MFIIVTQTQENFYFKNLFMDLIYLVEATQLIFYYYFCVDNKIKHLQNKRFWNVYFGNREFNRNVVMHDQSGTTLSATYTTRTRCRSCTEFFVACQQGFIQAFYSFLRNKMEFLARQMLVWKWLMLSQCVGVSVIHTLWNLPIFQIC